MRDLLYRGKRVENGEWIVGPLVPPCYIVSAQTEYNSFLEEWEVVFCEYEVEEETLGIALPGAEDKDGCRIFEGDIVAQRFDNDGKINEEWFEVYFDENALAFKLRLLGESFSHDEDLNREMLSEDFEVIGNKYDHPDMLRGWKANKENMT